MGPTWGSQISDRFQAGLHTVLGRPQPGQTDKTHLGPSLKSCVGLTRGEYGLKYRLQMGLSTGSMLAPC